MSDIVYTEFVYILRWSSQTGWLLQHIHSQMAMDIFPFMYIVLFSPSPTSLFSDLIRNRNCIPFLWEPRLTPVVFWWGHVIFLVVCVVLFCFVFDLSLVPNVEWVWIVVFFVFDLCLVPNVEWVWIAFFVFDLCLVLNVEWVWIVFLCLWSVSCTQCWMSLDCLFLIFSSVFLYRFYLMSWRQILSKFKSTICYQ